jgi:hypothetical protein
MWSVVGGRGVGAHKQGSRSIVSAYESRLQLCGALVRLSPHALLRFASCYSFFKNALDSAVPVPWSLSCVVVPPPCPSQHSRSHQIVRFRT